MSDSLDPIQPSTAGAAGHATTFQVIRVTEIGEYIRHHSCERRLKLEINRRRLARQLPFAERLFNTLDPVLQEAGRAREATWEQSLRNGGLVDLTNYAARPDDGKPAPWSEVVEAATGLPVGQSAYAREVQVSAQIEDFRLEGRIDFVLLLWREARLVLRLVECKASRRDRTYHRVQVAIYRMLVRELLAAEPMEIAGTAVLPEDVQCVVARIDEATNESQEILALEALDLEMEDADIGRLLAEDGALRRIVDADLPDLDFQLNQKCDGCVFNIHCLPESGRERRLELLGAEPSSTRALRAAGVGTIDDLAALDLDICQSRLLNR